jgi:phosphoenolpyruvate synthase/pyruvate phosphate dikinase
MKKVEVKPFDRNTYRHDEANAFTRIGDGRLGGKARRLAIIKREIYLRAKENGGFPLEVVIPHACVITTTYFERFMSENNLSSIAFSDLNDQEISQHFLKAKLPDELVDELEVLLEHLRFPLAIRSSSVMEDSLKLPCAGVYRTKLIPNSHSDGKIRLRQLTDAVKFVYSSMYFKKAKCFIKSARQSLRREKMAIMIQEVVGRRYNERFYPNISGVARSYNSYPVGHAKPEEGVVSLALGLGKTIVEGGSVWTYSPEYPEVNAPYNGVNEMLKQTQLDFWALNLQEENETTLSDDAEFLVSMSLQDAENDDTLAYIASTYDYDSDRISVGIGFTGSRIITFAPILQVDLLPLNQLIKSIMQLSVETFQRQVELEFAVTIDRQKKRVEQFGLLQVRPTTVLKENVDWDKIEISRGNVLTASSNVMGSGCLHCIKDIVWVDPETFSLNHTEEIAGEIYSINRKLVEIGIRYLLIGFGRWGTSTPTLGIPVHWGQISGARVIIESQLPNVTVDLSQGSHFFHNITNLGIFYISLTNKCKFPIDWDWIKKQQIVDQGTFVKHVRLKRPMEIIVDNRKHVCVIFKK